MLLQPTLCNEALTPQPTLTHIPPANPQLGGSGVLVQPMTYIFDEEPERWAKLLGTLGLDANVTANGSGKH